MNRNITLSGLFVLVAFYVDLTGNLGFWISIALALVFSLVGVWGNLVTLQDGTKGVFDLGMPLRVACLLQKLRRLSPNRKYGVSIRALRMAILIFAIRLPAGVVAIPAVIALSRNEDGVLKRLYYICGWYSPSFQKLEFEQRCCLFDDEVMERKGAKGLRFTLAVDLMRALLLHMGRWSRRMLRITK